MRNLFGIATMGFSIGQDNTFKLEGNLQDDGCNHTRLCEDALHIYAGGRNVFKKIPKELYMAPWVTEFTSMIPPVTWVDRSRQNSGD